MDDFEPCLQIIHISDLHIVSTRFNAHAMTRQISRQIKRWPPLAPLKRLLDDGTAPHDPMAPYRFEAFLESIRDRDAEWRTLPTWLICTGDITTFGDDPSLSEGEKWLRKFARHTDATLWLHGNHDEWPGTLPLFARGQIAQHHIQLEKTRRSWLMAPLQAPFHADTGALVQLYGLDSVLHSAWRNSWARGEIEMASIRALAARIDQVSGSSEAHHLRILATHHPVHYPNRPWYSMAMGNDAEVAGELDNGSPGGLRPLVHLVLSGHTHELFPELGRLPMSARQCEHPDLGIDQCQLIIGSLMQLDKFDKRQDWPHQCQVLRIYRSASKRAIALIERRLVGRKTGEGEGRGQGIGGYQFATRPSLRPRGEP